MPYSAAESVARGTHCIDAPMKGGRKGATGGLGGDLGMRLVR